jgi:general secretion pathway protein A
MYTEFYGLAHSPFNMTPDPAYLYLTKQHREALAGLTYAILDRKGFLVLSGMAGSGKTTLLAWVLQKLPAARIRPSVIFNPTLTRDEFLESIMLNFGMTDIPSSKAQRLWLLQKSLLQAREEGKANVLIIDEAHKLSEELLEEVRLLGNFERAEEKLLQILLVGQSELDDLLNRSELWQLKQRICVRLAIEPLSPNEVESYINHRWRVAGGKTAAPFSPEAIHSIVTASKCIPRLINSICDNALVLAFADGAPIAGTEHTMGAARDLRLDHSAPSEPEAPAPALAAHPVNGAVAVAEPAPSSAILKTIGGYETKIPKQSLMARWAGKLGLA